MDPQEMQAQVERELERGRRAFADASSIDELDAAQIAILGRKSPLGDVQRALGSLDDADERKRRGRVVNEARSALTEAAASRRAELDAEAEAALVSADRVDLTLPGRRPRVSSQGVVRRTRKTTTRLKVVPSICAP